MARCVAAAGGRRRRRRSRGAPLYAPAPPRPRARAAALPQDLDKRTVIHAWLSKDALIDATSKGYRAIWSVDGLYYLDALNEVWQSFYDVDILAGVTNASAIPLILGGETEMWGETADGSDVLQTIWPRAAAAAERQWSYDAVTNSSDPTVAPRLQAFRCMLLERGIPAAPVTNAGARQAPAGPGSCLHQ